MLRNKTTVEFWNILKYKIEGIMYHFVSLKKRFWKETREEKALRSMYKQTMWIVYWRTGYDEDYTNYKQAVNAATSRTEMRKSKRSMKHTQKQQELFYSHVRNKQKEPLEDGGGCTISQGISSFSNSG